MPLRLPSLTLPPPHLHLKLIVRVSALLLFYPFFCISAVVEDGGRCGNESQPVVVCCNLVSRLIHRSVALLATEASLTFYHASTNVNGRQTLSLCRTSNPEEKRRIIGDTFVKVADRTANDLNLTWDTLLLRQDYIACHHK
ncbi:hypothetical protein OUZ56_012026 [Daphnia magna]|uniref:Uncharacterized protein n=1 Tax=Daphnia magna TaxID=35525 RepID=A0ABQ9Z1U3_9CRUS|nr:hypothetical protein OUZ56_012026 [Daphnia magna]